MHGPCTRGRRSNPNELWKKHYPKSLYSQGSFANSFVLLSGISFFSFLFLILSFSSLLSVSFLLFLFLPPAQMGEVWRDRGQTHCQCQVFTIKYQTLPLANGDWWTWPIASFGVLSRIFHGSFWKVGCQNLPIYYDNGEPGNIHQRVFPLVPKIHKNNQTLTRDEETHT